MGVLGDIESRFGHMLAEQGTIARDIQNALVKAAHEIDAVAISHPAVLRIVQFLEQAAGVAASQPALRDPSSADQAASPDPTPAGQSTPADPAPTEAAASPASTTSSSSSEGTSTP